MMLCLTALFRVARSSTYNWMYMYLADRSNVSLSVTTMHLVGDAQQGVHKTNFASAAHLTLEVAGLCQGNVLSIFAPHAIG